ncbi:pre-tRNA nuclear export protein [Aspergillus nanangensis]|uniref:Exportin-T n=1 Tax=Aspergillus nanangensis TaxID=2582783 RepID=A0AAD4CYP1_ASPNN|nr:pre-tRNA nuclear export protein [Aspergillus nanangensis]
MEDQVANAIEIAWNPSSDQALKAQAFDYLNQLRSDPSGWPVCLALFTKSPPASEIVRHFSLDVVNSAAQGGLIDPQALGYVRDGLMTYLRQVYGQDTATPDLPSIQNKIAQTVTFLFSALYGNGWETFFDDILSLTCKDPSSTNRDNAPGIVFYLRVINSIHDEIGDVLVPRSRAEQDKANVLKDLIRINDMQKIASSWQQILSDWRDGNDLIVEMALKAVGRWVSWIDIGLVVNQTMLDLLFQQLGRAQHTALRDGEEKVRDAAVDVFTEIVGKKMKPEDKVDMIIFLNLDTIISQLSNSPPLFENRFTSKYDTDLAETVAKLVNITVGDIVRALESETIAAESREKAAGLLHAFLPHILRYFSDEYDEVCSTVLPCVSDFLQYLRKIAKSNPALAAQHSSTLLPIVKAIIAKMRYDDTSTWGDEDDPCDEAEFQDLRKRLGVLQQTVAAVNEQLYIDGVSEVVATTFENLRQSGAQLDWRDLDLALHEMFLFGDIAVKAGSLYNKGVPNNQAAERLVEMMMRMVESDIRSFTHPATQLGYMEICVRYSSFFSHHAQLIPGVLESFLQLIHHPMKKLKIRSWYLFQRLVRHLRQHIGNVAQTVVEALGDLLVIQAELNSEGSDGDDSDDHEGSADAVFTSQLYLFEAVGIICSSATVPADKQALYAQSVLSPVFADMEKHLASAKGHDERALQQIHHDIMALGTLAKGFSDWVPGTTSPAHLPSPEVSAVFVQASEATLVALESLKTSFGVRTAARFAFSRFVGVVGSRILPQLPRWIDGLLTQTSSRDEMALFLRLLDQVIFGFKGEIYGILDALLTPFLQRVFSGIADPTTGTDDEIHLAELKREYLNFLLAVLNNDLGAVIISERNQPMFDTVITTIEHFAKDVDDFTTAKMAFLVLSKMGSFWGGPDVMPDASNGTPTLQQVALPGFSQFMITRMSPLCWALPATPSFNSKDAQAKQVLAEAGGLQRMIYGKTGMEYIEYLRDRELPSMGMGAELVEEFVGALSRLDMKGFRQFFPSFIQRLSA